jgi:hypothetical protein
MTPEVAAMLHRTGQVTNGKNLGDVAEIAIRGTNNNDYHYPFRTYVNRARLIAANGDAANHVFWTQKPATVSTLIGMDAWLAAVEADGSSDPLHIKIVRNKPADIVTACWIGGVMITDQAVCDVQYPYFREPRTTAGDATTIYVMKCQLKPLDRNATTSHSLTRNGSRCKATFPTGVCDFAKPGVGFQPSAPWLTYANGPGGVPLGEAPLSMPRP